MSKTMEPKRLTFEVEGREPQSGFVRNPDATLGSVAAQVASRVGLAGTFQCLREDGNGETLLSPDTPLSELPSETAIRLSPQYTPA